MFVPLPLGSSCLGGHYQIASVILFLFYIYDWSVLHFDWHILKLCNSLCQGMSLSTSTDGRRLELPRTIELCYFNQRNPITKSIVHVNQSLLELLQRWGVHWLWPLVFFFFYLLIKIYIFVIFLNFWVFRKDNLFKSH